MKTVSMATRDELVGALSQRYGMSGRAEKTRILDEFVAVTGFHRKHAMRLLRGGPTARSAAASRPGRRLYDDAVREALVVLWEAGSAASASSHCFPFWWRPWSGMAILTWPRMSGPAC